RGKSFLGVHGAVELKSRVELVGNTISPTGNLREDQLVLVRMSEQHLVVETERAALNFGGIGKAVGQIQKRVAKHQLVCKSRAEHLGEVRSDNVRLGLFDERARIRSSR